MEWFATVCGSDLEMHVTTLPGFSDEPTRRAAYSCRAEGWGARLRWLRIGVSVSLIPALFAGCFTVLLECVCDRDEGDTARNQAFEIGKSIELYKLQQGSYPTKLGQLADPPKGKRLMERVPTDPWGQPYALVVPGLRSPEKFDVVSYGPDRVPYTDDDIGNWPDEP